MCSSCHQNHSVTELPGPFRSDLLDVCSKGNQDQLGFKMAEIVSTIAATVFDHSLGVIGRQIGYLWNYKKNVDDLKVQTEKLDIERGDKSHRVTVAEKNAERIRDGVKSWQSDADQISEEAKKILQAYEEKGKKRCFMDLSPSLVSRYRFSKRACEKGKEVQQVITKADQIKEVSDSAVVEGIPSALSAEGLLTFDSRRSTLEDIMKALQDGTKNTIGVYGFGGMGKTTLAKQVASRAAEEKMFEEIVLGSVTQTVDMKEIQGQIASMLGMSLSEPSVAERGCRIHERLKGKKVLIILDDLWKELDLKEVGIPYGVGHKGCKMLLTSRFLHVLASMGTDKELLLEALQEKEAWTLFEEKTTDAIRKPAFLAVGKEIAKRCAGLPVLIVAVAGSLSRQQDLKVWKDALTQLKKMNNKQMHDIVNSAIETISYNHLEASHKRLFLLIGLLGGDASIEQLLHYSLGWDLFDGEAARVEDARNSLHTMILDLKGSCLLLDGDNQRDRNSIRMHDVVRDVAISIAKKDLNLFLIGESDVELNAWHKDASLERCGAMVLRGCRSFPLLLECPSLKLFILSGYRSSSSRSIPDTVFEKTTELKVLDMSGSNFSGLPSSISFLKNLQTLRLENCHHLIDISQVGELKNLQILSFANSNIRELPSGIGQLSELRLLDLSYCSYLKVIPAGLIAGLSRLEELKMRGGFDRWDGGEYLNSSGRSNASLMELKHLTHLSTLEIAVSNAKLLSKDLDFEKWEKYEIIVGDMWGSWDLRYWLDRLEITRKIYLQHSTTSINHLEYGVKRLFKGTECLCLGELKDIKNVTPALDGDGFLELKHLRIQKNYEIQYIVNVEDRQQVSFPSLESLYLSHLMKLQQLCNGHLMEESFSKLTTVTVEDCNKLESLFYFSMATRLRCLREITVSKCAALENIVAEKGRDNVDVNTTDEVCNKIVFAQLRKLSLKSLPKLKNFVSNQKSLMTNVESEEIILEEAEFKSSMPFFEKVSFPELEELQLSNMSNLTHIWSHKLQEMPCCNLTKLTVQNCANLKYLFTSSMITVLVRLQELTIKDCAGMTQVVAKEEGETKNETIIFPQLSYLRLYGLSNLTTFYQGIEEMDSNENLEAIVQPLFNEKVQFPSLKSLHIHILDSIKAICPNTMEKTQSWKKDILTFQNLQKCEVSWCKGLRHVFPAYVARSLNQLEELSIQDCGVETIIGDNEDAELEERKVAPTFTFPKLTSINLESLPSLECFYPREHTIEWPALKNLDVVGCDKVSVLEIIQMWLDFFTHPEKQGDNSVLKVAVPSGTTSFKNLLEMEICSCISLKYLFTPSVAAGLEKVKEMTITKCYMLEVIVRNEEGEATIDTIAFPQLIRLSLQDLPNLTTFYSGVGEMNSNEKLDSDAQPLFSEQIRFPRLEELEIISMDSINTIWQEQCLYEVDSFSKLKQVKVTSCASLLKIFSFTMPTRSKINSKKKTGEFLTFQNLSEVRVDQCESLKCVFSDSVARSLNQLEELSVVDCGVETIIGDNEDAELEERKVAPTFTFPKLIRIYLKSLPSLECFYPREHTIEWPALKNLDVDGCDKVSVLDFFTHPENQEDNLVLKVAVPSGTTSFKNLLEMKICSCNSLKYLFTPSVAAGLEKVKEMTITKCSMLEVIVRNEEGEATIDMIAFPQLIRLLLQDLPNLTTFYSGVEEMNSNEKLNYHAQPLFGEQIRFPRLEELDIISMDSINTIWQEQFLYEVDSFSKLKQVTVTSCASLLKIYSFTMPTRSKINSKKKTGEFLTFQNLSEVRVKQCESLKCVFSDSVARSLNQLEELSVVDCGVETIIGDNEDAELEERKVAPTFTFPKLIRIYLKSLPSLECFYPREHTIEWPALKNLDVDGCDKVSVLDFFTHPENQEDNLVLKVFSSLEYLSIRSKDMMKILALCDLSPQPLHHLTSLTITEFNDESVAFPSKFLSIIHHQLQTFEICNCTFQEILPYPEEVIDHLFLPQLTSLELAKLPELTYICKQDQHLSFVPRILDRLASLIVDECPRLTNLVPPFVSFSSLERLYVGDCGLINLIQPSTARSLEKLEVLIICGCGMIEEIIGGEVGGDDEESSRDDEIIFSKLSDLVLEKLPRLTSFCSSRNYNFNFPSLEYVDVSECPNMKTFCGGITTTPNLRQVYTDSTGPYWEGGLNTTIQQSSVKMEATRLATAIPSISSGKHFEVEAQTHENSAEELSETIMEGQNATDQEKVADLCEKGKGKEVEEHFEKSDEMPRHSYLSCSSWTANSSGDFFIFASAAKGEVQTLAAAVPTIPPRNQIEEKVQFHDKPAIVLVEPRKEEMNGAIYELVNQDQVREIAEEALQGGNEVGMVTEPGKLADTCGKVEEQIIVRPIASQQNDFEDLHVSKQFIPLMSKVLEILQTRPLNNMSAQHVQFMEDAYRDLSAMHFPVEWLSPYVEKAKKWLLVMDRAKAVSEVELKIAQVEAQLQTLKETKKALQEENKVIAPSIDFDLDKPLYEE